jgi:hypothetical protein
MTRCPRADGVLGKDSQHMALLDASVQWLKEGRYSGARNGCFAVDTNGNATPDTSTATPCGR